MPFDPNKPFEVIKTYKQPQTGFDPNKPFTVIKDFQQPQQPQQPKVLKEGEGSDFARGFGTYFDQYGGI